MNIPPVLLLSVGGTFALSYALFITIGWAITRRNRKKYQIEKGIKEIPVYNLSTSSVEAGMKKSVSLIHNSFLDTEGNAIEVNYYSPFIAIGSSYKYPTISEGDLIFIDKDGEIKYAFEIPDLSDYR